MLNRPGGRVRSGHKDAVGSSEENFLMNNKEFKVVLAPDFEKSMIGIARHNGQMIAVYDFKSCIATMVEGGMHPIQAAKELADNIDNDPHGERSPAFVISYSQVIHDFNKEICVHGNN